MKDPNFTRRYQKKRDQPEPTKENEWLRVGSGSCSNRNIELSGTWKWKYSY